MRNNTLLRPALVALALVSGLYAMTRTSAPQMPPKPTEHHERIQKDVGMWDGEFEMNMMGQTMNGKVTERVEAFGDYWTISHMEGAVMGMPIAGTYQLGYDGDTKKYQGTWIESMSHRLTVMEGAYDEETGTLTMSYTGPDMLGNETKHWSTSTYNDRGQRVFKAYMNDGDGNEVHTMTITYTRRAEEEASDK